MRLLSFGRFSVLIDRCVCLRADSTSLYLLSLGFREQCGENNINIHRNIAYIQYMALIAGMAPGDLGLFLSKQGKKKETILKRREPDRESNPGHLGHE